MPSLSFRKKKHPIAQPRSANHVYIVEYPKSGITWLSTILANLALQTSGREDLRVTFANLRMIIPDIHLGQEIGDPVYTSPPIRFIKSHSTFRADYTFSIYLARHPVRVADSYYRYMKNRGRFTGSFSEFIHNRRFGVGSWCEHVDSWLKGPPRGGILHLIRYEDLVKDAIGEIEELCRNLGWFVSRDSIRIAVERSSSEHMRESEELFIKHDPRYSAGFVKGRRTNISKDDEAYILNRCRTQLDMLNYR
ncbi:sulfotransferase domain-containing protein [Celeribacter halophilus]|uniref:sulfotransferase domain-containing protein n=1 Tax=Celeribacter halophilus TaxID=576117 RepID=UPI003A8D808F